MKNFLTILPTQSLICFLFCAVGIVAFIFLIILPNQNLSAELDQEINQITARIEQQRILRPVFDSLLKRAQKKKSTQLPATKKVKLERGDILKVSERLQEIARRNELTIEDVNTDVDEIMNNTGYMLMRLHITGEFLKFRDFLLDLGTLPWLERIEEIKVRAIEGNREYNLRIWMAQK